MCIWSSFAFLGTLLLPSPYLFSPFSLYIYIHIYMYVLLYIYIYIHTCMHARSKSFSLSYAATKTGEAVSILSFKDGSDGS